MTLHPEIQKRAQKEIDSVVGPSRLPNFNDYDKLPFIRGLLFETLRWNPVTPLGVAHMVVEDDIYRGMKVPKGTTIIPNIWWDV